MKDISIGEVREKKEILEEGILKNVKGLVEKFEAETGIFPYSILIYIEGFRVFGEPQVKNIITEVRVGIEI